MFILIMLCFFFFKQKTAYELRISDWSSDVCSSDLSRGVGKLQPAAGAGLRRGVVVESDLQRCAASQPQPQLAVRQDRMLEFELRDLLQRQFDAELLLRQTHRPAELQNARQHRRAGKVIGKTGQLRRHRETDANFVVGRSFNRPGTEEHTPELPSLM